MARIVRAELSMVDLVPEVRRTDAILLTEARVV